jgi:hypothetical protein
VNEQLPELEAILRFGASAVLILGNETIEGKIANHTADAQAGYEVMIQLR